jgi:hypothetical protein
MSYFRLWYDDTASPNHCQAASYPRWMESQATSLQKREKKTQRIVTTLKKRKYVYNRRP